MIKISTIIPTCDRPAQYLREALESIRTQSFPASEILVVDNGTVSVCASDFPSGVKLFRLPPRVGPSRARNFGAAMAQGTHLAFLDDDDWWDADFLKEATNVLQNEGVRCVYGRKDLYRQGRIEPYKCPSIETLTVPNLLRRNPGTGGQNLLIEKELFWKIGGLKVDLKTSEDKALAIDILQLGHKIGIAPKAAAIFRDHPGARASQNVIGRLKFIFKYHSLASPIIVLSISSSILIQAIKVKFKLV